MPNRSPFALAALANAAVRGLEPATAHPLVSPVDDLEIALIHDDQGRQWIVRAPSSPAAGVRLHQEARLLKGLAGWLPFHMPDVAGTAPLLEGGVALVHRFVPGDPLDLSGLKPGPGLAAALGRALAAVHDLPIRLVEDAGMPIYSPEEYRTRRLAEVDRAAATGQVPARLMARWEKALEEAGAWRFVPCPVHGDLAADNVLVDGEEIVGIVDWAEARVADPADDLGWIAMGADDDAFESVVEAYAMGRREQPDRALVRRARLAGELSVARWLLHGVARDDAEVLDDAVKMLTDLDEAVADTPW